MLVPTQVGRLVKKVSVRERCGSRLRARYGELRQYLYNIINLSPISISIYLLTQVNYYYKLSIVCLLFPYVL
jgi:hypothetical protein